MRRANILGESCRYEDGNPEGYRAGTMNLGARIGAGALALKVFELPPGQSLCPYHYEYEEEWLIVLEGSVSVRTPEGEEMLAIGDIMCFASGPQGAHKVTHAGGSAARVMMFSSARTPAVAVYPDSDKIGVWPGNPGDDVMLRRVDGAVDYFDGER